MQINRLLEIVYALIRYFFVRLNSGILSIRLFGVLTGQCQSPESKCGYRLLFGYAGSTRPWLEMSQSKFNRQLFFRTPLLYRITACFYHNFGYVGSIDMGYLNCLIPVVQATGNGSEGIGHGNDFRIIIAENACLESTRFITALSYALLGKDYKGVEKNKRSLQTCI